MKTLTIHPKNEDQEKVIRMFLDALHVKYEKDEDETSYLLSSESNKDHLQKSIQQAEEGKVHSISLDDIWK